MNYKKNQLIDLHIHTNASDGTWDIKNLLRNIRKKEIQYFSVTDHDTFENSKKMLTEDLNGLSFTIGVEISSIYNNREYHILAYNFDYNNAELCDLISFNQKARKEYDISIIEYVKEIGVIKDVSDYRDYTYNRNRGGWNSLNYLIDKKIVNTKEEFFVLIKDMAKKPEFKEPKEVINTILSAGGVPILAHPTHYFPIENYPMDKLDKFKKWKIKGIECYSPYLKDIDDANLFIKFCKTNDLYITSGSDCHGEFLNRPLGEPSISLEDIYIPFFN